MSRPTCIISLDCEGKWGIADWISDSEHSYFRQDRLTRIYEQLIRLFQRYDLKVTFAFVGAFTLSKPALKDHATRFSRNGLNASENPWWAAFERETAKGNTEGWLNPDVLDLVAACPEHEIAAHGFTHIPLHEAWITESRFRLEMDCLKALPIFQGKRLTIVYPRNLIGFSDLLPQYGFIAYRKALKPDRATRLGRILNVMDEANVLRTSQPHARYSALVGIPSGFILNWRSGVRKKIPFFFTLKRWEHLLRHAIENGGVFHLWTHPHNFSSGERMFELMEAILDPLAKAVRAGDIVNMTQQEYGLRHYRPKVMPDS